SYEYKVLSANNGVAALAAVESSSDVTVRLILTDLDMPSMNGAAMVAAFRRKLGSIPVIIMSGLPPARDSPELARLGIQGVIGKPFKAEELLMLVRDLLDASLPP
ncbi:MAG TPA: response regulator, partial [Spirochaetia bacterium]|nr:response regulator [Spirochaetia bacterium]